jgi:hypothetical protein
MYLLEVYLSYNNRISQLFSDKGEAMERLEQLSISGISIEGYSITKVS